MSGNNCITYSKDQRIRVYNLNSVNTSYLRPLAALEYEIFCKNDIYALDISPVEDLLMMVGAFD